jgi:hypothetical protein
LHTVKNDYYEIPKNHFNSGCQDPRNHASQLQIDEKHMGLARGLGAKSFKIVHFK